MGAGRRDSVLDEYSEIMLSRASARFRPEGADGQGWWADYLAAPGLCLAGWKGWNGWMEPAHGDFADRSQLQN